MDKNNKYLGEGSFGCVLTPEIKCKGKETVIHKSKGAKNFVSKIFIDKNYYTKEVNASKILKKVDPSGKNILLPYKTCEVSTTDIYKNNEAMQCEELSYYKNNPKHHLYQLIMPYGGIRYDTYFKKNRPTLKDFFHISKPLFEALILLEKKSICQYDIRGANVLVGSNNKAIVIDHSLIIPYKKIYMASNLRRLKKAYYPYPPECIVYYQIYTQQDSLSTFLYTQFDESTHSYGETRYNAYASFIDPGYIKDALTTMHTSFKNIVTKYENANVSTYQNKLYKFITPYANRIDIYSVGMLIVTIFQYINYTGVSKNIKDDFVQFIKKLIEPNVFKRYTPTEAINNFNELLVRLK